MDTLQLVIDSISKIAIIPQSISQGISPQPIACLDALHKLGVVAECRMKIFIKKE